MYEKLYFQEMDRREKINARLSLPFAALVATSGLLSYLLNSSQGFASVALRAVFWILFLSAISAILVGAWFFRRAWFGHADHLVNTAEEIEGHFEAIQKSNEGLEQSEELTRDQFHDFLFRMFIKSSTRNSKNNDDRSWCVYRANFALTLSVILALLGAVPVYADKMYWKKSVQGADMSEKKSPSPPSPPPPPPERLVKGDIPKTPSGRPSKGQ